MAATSGTGAPPRLPGSATAHPPGSFLHPRPRERVPDRVGGGYRGRRTVTDTPPDPARNALSLPLTDRNGTGHVPARSPVRGVCGRGTAVVRHRVVRRVVGDVHAATIPRHPGAPRDRGGLVTPPASPPCRGSLDGAALGLAGGSPQEWLTSSFPRNEATGTGPSNHQIGLDGEVVTLQGPLRLTTPARPAADHARFQPLPHRCCSSGGLVGVFPRGGAQPAVPNVLGCGACRGPADVRSCTLRPRTPQRSVLMARPHHPIGVEHASTFQWRRSTCPNRRIGHLDVTGRQPPGLWGGNVRRQRVDVVSRQHPGHNPRAAGCGPTPHWIWTRNMVPEKGAIVSMIRSGSDGVRRRSRSRFRWPDTPLPPGD
jgi:hypothetical protein